MMALLKFDFSVIFLVILAGGLRGCGWNAYGEIGNGAGGVISTPSTTDFFTGLLSLSAGQYHTCGRLTNNSVRCWGLNTYGQVC